MKQDIIKVLKSQETDEDKLNDISEIVLAPNKKIRREFAASFIRAAAILSMMMDDYQFDPRSSDYCGFLNTSGENHNHDSFNFLITNISLFEGFIHKNGFKIQKCDFNEFIIQLIKEEIV